MWEIHNVPAKPPFPPDNQPTVNVFASAIDPKAANSVVRRLNQIAHLESLRHVKRVKKERLEGGKFQLYVILCTALDGDEEQCYQLSAFVIKVCEFPASSKEEWKEQCKQWPTSYHSPSYNIDGITGFKMMLTKSETAQVCNAAIVVDSLVRQVIASATDEVFHSHDQENGAQTPTTPNSNGTPNELKYLYGGVSCLHPWKWINQQLSYSDSCNWHPLRHAALSAVDYSEGHAALPVPGS